MKTTLKKGLGRTNGAGPTGGDGDPPGSLPPWAFSSPSSLSLYRQPARRRGAFGLLALVLTWLVAALTVVGAGLAGGFYLYTDHALEDIVATTPDLVRAQELLDVAVAGEPATVLVIGYDHREGIESETNGARSDTVMLIRADPQGKTISMLSFPRDLRAEIHCPGRAPFSDRINTAYSECGVRGTLQTVSALTRVPINYLVTVNFHGFKQVVANLGGVWIDVDRRYFNDNSGGGDGYATIDLQPGYQKLNGAEALDYVRYRHTDNDFFRLARQQHFVKSFTTAVTTSIDPNRVTSIVDVIRDNVEVGRAGGGAISKRALMSYALVAYELPKGHFFQARIDLSCYGEDDLFVVTVEDSCIRDAVADFADPDVAAPENATLVALGKKPKETAPPPTNTTVVVLNGNGVPGAAADTSFQLGQRQYLTLTPPDGMSADAPTQDYERSKVYFNPEAALPGAASPAASGTSTGDEARAAAEERTRAAARRIARLVGEADVEPIPSELEKLANGAMVLLVVGRAFGGQLAPVPVDDTPVRKPPAVAENRALTESLLREAQKQVRWPVYVPTVVERTSTLSQSTPIRVYKLARGRTVRLTFVTGNGQFWGVQMMKWPRAPALADPNRKLYIKGRRYELHYSGSHLRIVVLRHDGVTYWVVNTLMNSLSNETMLEIAKGLRPVQAAR